MLALVALLATPAAGQDAPPFLLLNQERILTGSEVGQALLAEEEAARDALRAEAREIDARFEAEERRLTGQRAELEPEAFREIADNFDTRVIEARREQDARSNALAAELEGRRRQFYNEVGPILVTLLSRYGAHAVFDESAVLLADQSLNVTDAVIAEIDARASEARNDRGAESVGDEGAPEPALEGTQGGALGLPSGQASGDGDMPLPAGGMEGFEIRPRPAERRERIEGTELPAGETEGAED